MQDYKSEGERQIAGCLKRHGIAFLYEHPFAVAERGKVRIWYPDFLLAEHGILIEYVGVNGERDYDRGVERKKAAFEAMGMPALFLDSDFFHGYWPGRLLDELVEIERGRVAGLVEARRSSVPRGEARVAVGREARSSSQSPRNE